MRPPWRVAVLASWGALAVGCSPDAGQTNLVLVSMDTLRADRLGAYGNTRELTPNLDRFADQAIVFEDAYSQANDTLYSHASLLTSRYPSELGRIDWTFSLPPDVANLAGVLRVYGYATAASVAGGYLSPTFGFDNGFDDFRVPQEWGSLYHSVPQALDWLDGRDKERPFFLLVHGYDAHSPYIKPTPFGYLHASQPDPGPACLQAVRNGQDSEHVVDGRLYEPDPGQPLLDLQALRLREPQGDGWKHHLAGRAPSVPFSERDAACVTDAYDGAVAYLDALFGLFMAELQDRQLLDDTVIVVLADHGEELGEHGTFDHRYWLSEEVLHVPLMIRLPGGLHGGQRVGGPVELVDVAPTLLALAGAEPPASARGHNLLDADLRGVAPSRPAAFSEGAFRMVSARSGAGRLGFAGLSADSPALASVLGAASVDGPSFFASQGLDEAARGPLREALVQWRASLPPTPSGGTPADPAVQQQLQERGYWRPQ